MHRGLCNVKGSMQTSQGHKWPLLQQILPLAPDGRYYGLSPDGPMVWDDTQQLWLELWRVIPLGGRVVMPTFTEGQDS